VAFPFSSLQIKLFWHSLLKSAFNFHLSAEQGPLPPENPSIWYLGPVGCLFLNLWKLFTNTRVVSNLFLSSLCSNVDSSSLPTSFLPSLLWCWGWTLGLVQARQTFYHWDLSFSLSWNLSWPTSFPIPALFYYIAWVMCPFLM
jgi:hypothetical protein